MKTANLIKRAAIVFAAGLFFAGCKKQEFTQQVKSPSMTDTAMVTTPFGPRHRADMHLIPSDHQLLRVNGHLQEVEMASGKLINDFGVQKPLEYLSSELGPASKIKMDNLSKMKLKTDAGISPSQVNPQWKTWAQSTQTKQGQFSLLPAPQTFSTTWTVPSLPATYDGQTIYIFNGLEDDNGYSILQPVMQFGNAYTGGTTSWQISNYYVPCGNCAVYFSTPVTVNPGDAINGYMQNSGSTGSLNWTSTMYKNGTAVTTLNASAYVEYPLTTLYEAIESINVTSASDYPADNYIAMHPSAGAGNPVENFTPYINSSATLGEHTVVPSLGEVDLYFHPYTPPPPVNNIAEIDITNSNVVYYWTKSGTVSSGTTTNSTAYSSPAAYTLPSGKTPSNIVGIAIANTGWFYYWYDDGTMSVGTATNATAYIAPKTYALPTGETPGNIRSMSIAKSNNYVYAWYKDGTASIGNSTSLAAYRSPYTYTVAAGKTISEVVGIGIEGSDDHCFAWYNDGTTKTVSSGISNQFDYYFAPQPASF